MIRRVVKRTNTSNKRVYRESTRRTSIRRSRRSLRESTEESVVVIDLAGSHLITDAQCEYEPNGIALYDYKVVKVTKDPDSIYDNAIWAYIEDAISNEVFFYIWENYQDFNDNSPYEALQDGTYFIKSGTVSIYGALDKQNRDFALGDDRLDNVVVSNLRLSKARIKDSGEGGIVYEF